MHGHQHEHRSSYVPALGFDWLTPLYDPLLRLLLRERPLKQRLIEQARIEAGHAVLDVGCGTGTLAIMVKQACPGARVVGLDGDPKILQIARRKAAAAGLEIELVEAMAYDPPLPPRSFDRVLSTLVFHHLTVDEKRRTLEGVRALLRPGGELHLADFGRPHNLPMKLVGLPLHLHGGGDRMAVHLRGELPALIEQAGFSNARLVSDAMTPFGTLSFFAASAPA